MDADPIEGQVLVLTAAKASVPPARLPQLVDRGQAHLREEREHYRHEYERIHADERVEAFLVPDGHWDGLGAKLELRDRELSALCRAHNEQFHRIGRRVDREQEFETALEIRDPVLIGRE
ncbi:hypothetical protein ACLI4Z_08490 [Natrialbaceae archaeon A-arb3/5]